MRSKKVLDQEVSRHFLTFFLLTFFLRNSGGDFRSFIKAYVRHRLQVLKADNFEIIRIVISEVLVSKELREIYSQRIFAPTFALAEKYFQQWVAQRMIKPIDVELTMRAVSGMVLGMIVEYVMGDELLQERWDDLPDVITDLILDGLLERSDKP